jgi:periplasmic copper chaperone A
MWTAVLAGPFIESTHVSHFTLHEHRDPRFARPAGVANIGGMRTLAVVVLTLALTGCSGGSGVVEITDGWAGSMPPTAETAAIYLTIENGTSRPVRIVEVTSPRCGAIELHESRLDDQQIMRMRIASEDAMTIGRGDTFEMIPGQFHVMCIDVREPFVVGDDFDVTVDFDDGSEVTRDVVVENR